MPRFLIYNSVIKIKALRSLSAQLSRDNFHIFAGCRAADLLQRFFERYFYHRLRIDLIRSDLEIRETRIQVIVEADNGNVLRHGDAAFFQLEHQKAGGQVAVADERFRHLFREMNFDLAPLITVLQNPFRRCHIAVSRTALEKPQYRSMILLEK